MGAPPTVASSLRTVLLAFGLSRLVVVACGWLALSTWGIDAAEADRSWRPFSSAWPLIEMALRYDAQWYLTIARDGYAGLIDGPYSDMRPNFMPLFPLMMRALAATGIPLVAAGLTLANAGAVIGLACLHQLVAREGGTRLATRVVWIVALFPSSLFLSSIYREGPLMAWTMGAWLAASRGRTVLAGALALGATLTSALGALVLLPLTIVCWRRDVSTSGPPPEVAGGCDARHRSAPLSSRFRSVALIVTPSLLGLAGYLWWAEQTWGDALMLVRTQWVYRDATSWPWMAFVNWWQLGPALHGYANSSIDAALAIGSLLAIWWLWRRTPAEYAVFAAAAVLAPLSSGLIAFSRMLLAAPVLATTPRRDRSGWIARWCQPGVTSRWAGRRPASPGGRNRKKRATAMDAGGVAGGFDHRIGVVFREVRHLALGRVRLVRACPPKPNPCHRRRRAG